MSNELNNKELSVSVQYVVLAALWMLWPIAWVEWKAHEHARRGQIFAEPREIYAIMRMGLPAVLAGTGWLVCLRVRPVNRLSRFHRALYYLFAALSVVAAVLAVYFGLCPRVVAIRD